MIDYSYLSPPSKVNRIKVPSTLLVNQIATSIKMSMASLFAAFSLGRITSHLS